MPTGSYGLPHRVEIPALGLGVYRSPPGSTTQDAILTVPESGYRHIDTASTYGNEADVGEAARRSGLAKEDVFVTTKLWNADHGYKAALTAVDVSLDLLGFDYVDLYLVHWPVPDLRLDTWRAMESILAQGTVRAIGVSNHMPHHIDEVLAHAQIPPAVNKFELSPYNYGSRRPLPSRSERHRSLTRAVLGPCGSADQAEPCWVSSVPGG
jgi:diketogulonate reductase-like aldo/keto reductase